MPPNCNRRELRQQYYSTDRTCVWSVQCYARHAAFYPWCQGQHCSFELRAVHCTWYYWHLERFLLSLYPEQCVTYQKLSVYLMMCWLCVTAYQCHETNVMHVLFSLLRIKGLYMFQALLAHPKEVLHKQHLVYCVRVMSVGCGAFAVTLQHRTPYSFYRMLGGPWSRLDHQRAILKGLVLTAVTARKQLTMYQYNDRLIQLFTLSGSVSFSHAPYPSKLLCKSVTTVCPPTPNPQHQTNVPSIQCVA
jgi:hypothetical protein